MPRARTILQSQFPYNIGARCINRDWFSIPMADVWSIMSDQLFFIHHAFSVKIHAFVLMTNHFHLLLSTPDSNLDLAFEWFMRESSRAIVRAGNRINQTYGGPYFRSVVSSTHYYLNAYKYLYYNPVKAGICGDVVDYPYSTLQGLLGRQRMHIPVEEDTTLFSDVEEHWQTLGRALRRQEFKLPKANSRLHALETDTL